MKSSTSKRETSTYMAWQAHFGVRLQLERLRTATDLPSGHGQLLVDSTALVIALWRLRLAAEMSARLPGDSDSVKQALNDFDTALPGLTRLRNVTMHFDNYALGNEKRQNQIGDPPRLVDSSDLWDMRHFEGGFSWLEVTIDYDRAESAARSLYDAIQESNNSQLEYKQDR